MGCDIEKVLEAMDITSNTAKIRLVAFQLEGESQVWWDWIETSKDLEAMTWVEFHGLFMSKYFPATVRHAKAQEFLELKQRTMIVMEYVARFTKLACFGDDYVAIDTTKVRRFENRLKLSIRGKIVGLPPTGHGLYGWDSSVYRAECRWEEEGGSAFFEFGKET